LATKQKSIKTRRSSGFRKLLWNFSVNGIDNERSKINDDNNINHLYKEGFDNLHEGFKEFLAENEVSYDTETGYFNIYSSVAVESTNIIRTDGKFHGKEWFSDVAVSSEDLEWYGKVF